MGFSMREMGCGEVWVWGQEKGSFKKGIHSITICNIKITTEITRNILTSVMGYFSSFVYSIISEIPHSKAEQIRSKT